MIRQIGAGFFLRAVNAVCFSFDALYICAIGCDEKHTMGIWNARTGSLILSRTAGNDIPPQIKTLLWAPEPQNTKFINQSFEGTCDLFVTLGI